MTKKTWSAAYITGGGSGIGLCLAKKLLQQGANVALFDLNFDDATKAALEQQRQGAKIAYFEVDVRDAPALASAVTEGAAAVGAPDLAINVAGIQIAKTFDTLAQDEFELVVAINLFGSRNFAAAVLPHLLPGTQLALVGSMAGLVPNYTYAAYSASKYGVVGLAGTIRIEFKAKGIDVSVICPPELPTPMVEKEKETMHPIAEELKAVAGTIELDGACEYMLRALRKRRYMIIPGFKARIVWRLNRWLPGLLQSVVDSVVKKHSNTSG